MTLQKFCNPNLLSIFKEEEVDIVDNAEVDEDVEVVVEAMLDVVVIEAGLARPDEAAEEAGEVKEGLKQLVDPFSLLGVAKRSSLETASIKSEAPFSCFGELEVVTSARPLVLESGISEFKFNSGFEES